jgi:hypothetical protein
MDSANTPSSLSPLGGSPSREEEGVARLSKAGRLIVLWSWLTPFFISAFLFLSAFFAVLAPLPLLALRFRRGRAWAWSAVLTNSALVAVLGGRLSLALYSTFVAVLTVVMAEMIHLRQSILRVATTTLSFMALMAILVVGFFAHRHNLGLLDELNREVTWISNNVANSFIQNGVAPSAELPEFEEWKDGLAADLPSGIAIFALILVWANLSALLRLNPGGVRERMGLDASFLRTWKAPEALVWPTLLCGAIVLFSSPGSGPWGAGWLPAVAINGFRILMAVYAIQGLSILSFCFDAWNVRGPVRAIGFVLSVFLMMPLLLGLGFFDLWFDFRSRIRQS